MEIAKDNVRDCSYRVFKSNIKAIIKDFDRLELKEIKAQSGSGRRNTFKVPSDC